jgi:hypothetical protein
MASHRLMVVGSRLMLARWLFNLMLYLGRFGIVSGVIASFHNPWSVVGSRLLLTTRQFKSGMAWFIEVRAAAAIASV